MLTIVQGLLGDETGTRVFNVTQVPENIRLSNVRLPHTLAFQSKPLKGSVVIVAKEGDYKSYIIAVLREPQDFVGDTPFARGLMDGFLQPGEIFFESRGDLNSPTPGTGASFFLGNNGTCQILSGKAKESLTIGGNLSDEDGEVTLQGDNGSLIGNINHITNMQSSFDFDSLNNIHIGNSIVTVPTTGSATEVVINELTMDTFGNIELRNTTAGITKTILSLDAVGQINLKNTVGGMHLDSVGLMTLNDGTLGAARLTDTVTSSTATDIQYWQMISAIQTFFMSLSAFAGGSPIVHSELGALGLAYLAQVPIAPPSLTSKITSASSTVKVG